jgi:hypothetical protein
MPSVDYQLDAINARLQGTANTIDGGGGNGLLFLLAGPTVVSTISLARPCGTVNGGVLTFSGTLLDPAAAATGAVDGAMIEDSTGATVITGLTVGVPGQDGPPDIIISNGLNSTLIATGQTVQVLSAKITGS